ncbi:hypothetical protein L227DRAFT_263550 [Lentinus tigrinus ALCF2SS1-6]|uniref:Uncharacterized protein n=1 Tax=Lentinus tigrinus ALCF2SS1-6 TaxID=1328759 RepID=A0A5C2SMW3_9APHY|nr:hypothetical protein L227DRAFT_263550 [Lentinus tigrinus ALCF2SS1-6]
MRREVYFWAVGRWRAIHGASLPSSWRFSRPHAAPSELLGSANRPIGFTHGLAIWWSYDPQMHTRRRRTSRVFQSRSQCLPLLTCPFFRRPGHMSRSRMHVCCAIGDLRAPPSHPPVAMGLLVIESVPLPPAFRWKMGRPAKTYILRLVLSAVVASREARV